MLSEKEKIKARKKFVKDEKIPIPVYENCDEGNYFDYFIDLYEDLFNAKTKYNRFEKIIESMGWENYFHSYNKLKDNIINHIKDKDSYKIFLNMDMKQYSIKREFICTNRQFYTTDNIGKKWISIDLSKANFYSLKFVNNDIVDNFNTYEEWIEQFEGGNLFRDSKSIRQVIFGNLNPKRQQKVQEFIMNTLMQRMHKLEDSIEFWVMGSDEFIIEYNDKLNLWLEEELTNFEKETGFKFKKEVFTFNKNGTPSEFGFIRSEDGGKHELKGVSKDLFAQAYKYFKKDSIHPFDLVFYHEKQIATFKKPLKEYQL